MLEAGLEGLQVKCTEHNYTLTKLTLVLVLVLVGMPACLFAYAHSPARSALAFHALEEDDAEGAATGAPMSEEAVKALSC